MTLFGVTVGVIYAAEATEVSSLRLIIQVIQAPLLCAVMAYGIVKLDGFHYWIYMLLSVFITIAFSIEVGIGDLEPVAPASEGALGPLGLLALLLWLSSLAALLLPSNVKLFWWRLDELPE